jgi:thiol-disulfide isomerase/thioredoxin
MSTGVWFALAAVVIALGFGVYRAATDGRFRGTHRVRGAEAGPEPVVPFETARPSPPQEPPEVTNVLAGTPWESELGERATLLQFSSAFCAPCRATRRILADVAADTPGVEHIDIDAEHHLVLVRRLGVLRTPTTLLIDSAGRELQRASGVPRREQVFAALDGAGGKP